MVLEDDAKNVIGDPSKRSHTELGDPGTGPPNARGLNPWSATSGMRWFERYLRVGGWSSCYRSVQRLLDHLSRKTRSESSRRRYLETLAALCKREGKDPDQMVRLSKGEVEDAVQTYLDVLNVLFKAHAKSLSGTHGSFQTQSGSPSR